MSRSFVLGNGTVLMCFDRYAQVRDFYFPYAGLENHIGSGNVHKIGVWVDGVFSWLSDGGWAFSIDYQKETLASKIFARNDALGVELTFLDVVYNEKNIFLRTVVVKNTTSHKRDVRVFFNHQFQISETTHADTAYYNPSVEAIVHYKGRRVFLVGGLSHEKRFDDYSVGIFKIEGKEGTWRDAEDGELSKNPIEHGSVDSTIRFSSSLEAGTSFVIEYWITVGETFREASGLQDLILKKTPAHISQTTQDFWKAWVNKFNFTFYGLDERVVSLFKKSLLIIRTHCDNRGGILASGDSDNFRYGRDTYAYVWPRDGAFVALALDKAGYFDISHRFYEFSNEVITADGYLLHKYQPDKSFGSSWHPWIKNGKSQLAIQEDETALLIVGLWEHYKKNKDLEFIESLYNSFIKKGADFMVRYREGFVTQLPYESYDLWEERNGISPFTASSVYAALKAAAQFSELLGKEAEKETYEAEALEIQQAIIKYFFNEETKYFDKTITVEDDALKPNLKRDTNIDISAFSGIFRFGVLPPHDAKMLEARKVIEEKLHAPIPVGGYARYQSDAYYEVSKDVPGNPFYRFW
jgi:GH15 family glucan-1,4-alpha-glucosidase